ncbi:MAG: JAB domain-containing protein [Verrucomicrobiae bacterium]|nr:JAB domain-containing protein [Verrucomicrobiae bacterium]
MIREIKILTLREVSEQYDPMDHPAKLVEFWRREVVKSAWYESEKEQLLVLSLDAKMKVKTFNLVSLGIINQTLVHAREIFRPAIVSAASHIAIMHNHPSGDPTPSADDLKSARAMRNAGKVLGIPCVDFLIVGNPSPTNPDGFASLKMMGLVHFGECS